MLLDRRHTLEFCVGAPPRSDLVAFGEFEIDLRQQELRRDGQRVKLQEQPAQVLTTLLERPGEIVTKDELRERLWPDDTHVAFDNSLSVAILKLRRALDDEAARPHFIETIPRRGYRFIAPLEAKAPVPPGGRVTPGRFGRAGRSLLIVAILVALGAGAYWHRWGSGSRSLDSLAILPFEGAGGDAEVTYLCEGIPRSIASRLARASTLKVIPPQFVSSRAGPGAELEELARELEVEAVLVGGLSEVGERVSLDVQLIEPRTGRLLWGDRYDEGAVGLPEIEEGIADGVLASLGVALTPEDRQRVHTLYTRNGEAYRALLKGSYVFQHGAEGMGDASEWFEKAVEIDPNYAPAWVCLYTVNLFGGNPEKAREAAERAIEIGDLPVWSEYRRHFLRASLLALFDREWEAAEKEYERARALNPDFEMPNYYLMWTGHLEEVVDQIDRHTTEGAPWQIGWIPPFEERYENTLPLNVEGFASLYLSLGEIDRAMEQAHWLLAMDSRLSPAAHILLADCHFLKGQEDDAMREWLAAMSPALPEELRERFRVAHAESGMKGVWQLTLDLLPEQAPLDRKGPFYARLGNRDRTFEWLEHAIETPSFFPDFLDPYVAPMRDDPRFERLLRRANLPEDAIARHLAYEADGWLPRESSLPSQ